MVIMHLFLYLCVCFYKGKWPRPKVEHFVSVHNYNLNKEPYFFKRFTVQMTSTQLNAHLTELSKKVPVKQLTANVKMDIETTRIFSDFAAEINGHASAALSSWCLTSRQFISF